MNATSLLKKLISIPSVNPEGAEAEEGLGEAEVVGYLSDLLQQQGWDVTRDEVLPGRPNLLAVIEPATPHKTLLVTAHLDTVITKGMRRPPFEPVVENGRLYGRGACDDKGPMAAFLAAVDSHVQQVLKQAGVRLIFLGAMGEEKGNTGAQHFVAHHPPQIDECLVLEPTSLNAVYAHKSALWIQFTIHGRAGHGSNPGVACNAIEAMMRFLADLRQHSGVLHCEDEVLGSTTMNVGSIQGGHAVNVVPHHCVAEVDWRLLPAQNPQQYIDLSTKLLNQLKQEGLLVDFEIEILESNKAFISSKNSPVCTRLRATSAALNRPFKAETAAWFSDAGPLGTLTENIVILGPGSIKQAHTSDEYIELYELEAGAELFRAFLLNTAREMPI